MLLSPNFLQRLANIEAGYTIGVSHFNSDIRLYVADEGSQKVPFLLANVEIIERFGSTVRRYDSTGFNDLGECRIHRF